MGKEMGKNYIHLLVRLKLEIQELTAQMAALRAELENLRAENSQN